MFRQLKIIRIQNKFTQQQIADVLGITRSAYCGYEIGRRTPDVDTLVQLSKFYKLPLECFIYENGSEIVNDSARDGEKATVYLSALSKEERDLICKFRMSTDEQKEQAMKTLEKA